MFIPDVNNGSVVVKDIARDPGSLSKVMVDGVNAVGACIGFKGQRIKLIKQELREEEYSSPGLII